MERADTLLKIDWLFYHTLKEDDPMKQEIDQDKVVLYEAKG